MPGATIIVNTLEDQTTSNPNDSKCSLREAIRNVNNNNQSSSTDCLAGTAGDVRDTSNLATGLSGKITLASKLPAITDAKGLTIDGRKARIDVSGNKQVQVVSMEPDAQLTLKSLTLTDGNSSGSAGGVSDPGTLKVVSSTFSGNTGFEGGGIYNAGDTLTVTNSTFFSNGGEEGNDIANGGTVRVIDSTFSNNTLHGGGIVNSGTEATLRNTILADDLSGKNCVAYVGSPFTDEGYNISDDGSCNFDEATSTPQALPPWLWY
jgi:CSLREA domain-containing protein